MENKCLICRNTSQQFPVTVQLIEQTKLLSDQSGIEQDTNESASVAPETWGMWGRFPASSPHTQRLIRTASGVCQSPGSAYSWPEPEDCTGGSSQTPDRCSALAARYQRDPLKRRKRRQSHNIFFFLFTAVLENACLGFKMLADFCLALIVAEVCVSVYGEIGESQTSLTGLIEMLCVSGNSLSLMLVSPCNVQSLLMGCSE